LGLIKTIILAHFFNAGEQECAQAGNSDHNRRPQQDRSAIHTLAQKQGQCTDNDIRETARQVEEILGLPLVGQDKNQPSDDKGQANR